MCYMLMYFYHIFARMHAYNTLRAHAVMKALLISRFY